jgi:hypothetical protein
MKGTNRTIARLARFLALGALLVSLAATFVATPATAQGKRPPSIKTLKPYGVNDTEAVLDSSVSPRGWEVVVRFQYGRTTSYGHITWVPEEDPYPYYQHQEFEEVVEDLSPNTVYHYRAVISYGGKKKVYGNDVRFKTQRP